MKALPKILLALTGVAALSLAYPASVHAVPTTYVYTGHHFTVAAPPYTTSHFVTAMVTLAGPLGANMPLTEVTATAFTLFDGVQTIRSTGGGLGHFEFATNARGEITTWYVTAELRPFGDIGASYEVNVVARDVAQRGAFNAFALDNPGEWRKGIATPDAGSTPSLMTLTLMALGLVARRFQRADRARAGRSSLLAFHHQARYIG